MMGVESAYRPASAKPVLRLAGLVASITCVAAAIYSSRIRQHDDPAWWFLGAAFVLTMLWQYGLALGEAPVTKRPVAPGCCRCILGGVLAVGGVALWVWAPLV